MHLTRVRTYFPFSPPHNGSQTKRPAPAQRWPAGVRAMPPRNDIATSPPAAEPGPAGTLDGILRGLAEQAPSGRTRRWAARLRRDGEGAASPCSGQATAGE